MKPVKKKRLRLVRPKAKKPSAWFSQFTKAEQFEESQCVWCEPMLAQEISEAEQEKQFNSPDVYVEEKFDGTRAILQFFDNNTVGIDTVNQRGFTRCFSRRVSKKTGWFCENTDSLPHLREINEPSLAGTIIDGEMFIDGRPFKDVSSTLNCLWDEAVRRQTEIGNITFHAFDILRYGKIDCEKMPLEKRKQFLQKVVTKVNHPNLVMVPYYDTDEIEIRLYVRQYAEIQEQKERYPELWKQLQKQMVLHPENYTLEQQSSMWARYRISKKAYYEYIVSQGGEGVILKPKDGKYYHKRGKEYMKVKKFLTRDVIVTGFIPPTREYTGIFPKDRWNYWVGDKDKRVPVVEVTNMSAKRMKEEGYIPVTRFYYYRQIGTIEYGVILNKGDKKKIAKIDKLTVKRVTIEDEEFDVLVVGDCGGFTDDEREYMTEHQEELIGTAIEVKANELFKDTGKMRHPRFLRFRDDKNVEECTWEVHTNRV